MTSSDQEIATRHLGIIASCCITHWKRFPLDVKTFYDLEDMISDVVLHVVKVAEKYDARKAKESTWVHHVSSNYCKTLVSMRKVKRFSACQTVELTPAQELSLKALSMEEVDRAIDAVEAFISIASDGALDLLEQVLEGRLFEIPYRSIEDFRAASARSRLTLRDLELVYRYSA